jgi:ribosomal protein S18 acetylase RimI-like enzyme
MSSSRVNSIGRGARAVPELELRALHANHKPAVESVLRGARVFREEEIRTALDVFDEALRPYEDYHTLGAFLEGSLAGYTCYGPTPMTDGCWHLYWIAVHQAFQRRGIAQALMERVLADCRANAVRLLTLEASGDAPAAAARAFYESVGFREEARVRDFYRPGDDVVHYVVRFTPARAAAGATP